MKTRDSYQDPLENFTPPNYADPLESVLADVEVAAIPPEPFVAVDADTELSEAIEKLANSRNECLLVVQRGQLVGIWTLWDVLRLLPEEAAEQPLSAVMRKDPAFVRVDDSVAAALSVVALYGYRHVPVLDSDDRIVGVVTPPQILAFLQARAGSS